MRYAWKGWLFTLLLLPAARLPLAAQPATVLQEARLQYAEGNYAAASARLAAYDEGSLSPDGRRLLGLCYQGLHRHQQAVRLLSEADTTDTRVLAALARSLDQLGQVEAAERRYHAAYRQDSTNVGVTTSLARLYADAGAWEEVRDLYRRLLQEDPENPFFHAWLGSAYRGLDSTDQAIVHYERAHRINPRDVRVVQQLSAVYFSIGHFISARRVVDRAIEALPQHPALWKRRGEIALQEEHYDMAQTAFGHVLTYGDSTALNLRNYGVSLYLGQDIERADTLLTLAYQADSSDTMGAFYLGMARQQRDRFEEALYYLTRATDLAGQDLLADMHAQIATTYDRMDRDAEAIRVYRLALTLAPAKTEVLFHLAALYDTYYADHTAALAHYERFLAQVGDEQTPRLQAYARQRVQAIREKQFFQQEATPAPAPAATDTVQRGSRQ